MNKPQPFNVSLLSDADIQQIVMGLKKHGKVRIRGLGIFETKEIAGRKAYNPVTRDEAYMNPYMKIKFRPCESIKREFN